MAESYGNGGILWVSRRFFVKMSSTYKASMHIWVPPPTYLKKKYQGTQPSKYLPSNKGVTIEIESFECRLTTHQNNYLNPDFERLY